MELLLVTTPTRTRVLEVGEDQSAGELYDAVEETCGLPMAHHYLVYNGARLPPDGALSVGALGMRAGDVVRAVPRLIGGGGDGGAYPPTATELKWMNDIGGGTKRSSWAVLGGSVRTTQFERVSNPLRLYEMCTTCALTGEPLKSPVVCCELGMLYNKEAVLEAMLNKAKPPLGERFAHVRGMKDLLDVTLHKDPAYDGKEAASASTSDVNGVQRCTPFCCPVTNLPFNGRRPFFAVRPSGHVVSWRALAMAKFETCPVTEQPLAPAPSAPSVDSSSTAGYETRRFHLSASVIPLVLTDDELEYARTRMDEARAAQQQQRKRKGVCGPDNAAKRGSAGETAAGEEEASSLGGASATEGVTACAAGCGKAPAVNSLVASRTASQVQQAVSKKTQSSDVFKSLFVTKESKEAAASSAQAGRDFMTRAIRLPARPASNSNAH